MAAAWVLGCILTATLVAGLLFTGALSLLSVLVAIPGILFPSLLRFLLRLSDLHTYLPTLALFTGCVFGFRLAQRFPVPPPWVGWLLLLLSIPPLLIFLAFLVFNGEVGWTYSWENLWAAVYFLWPLFMAVGYAASGIALIAEIDPRIQTRVLSLTIAILVAGVGAGKLRDLLGRWNEPKTPGSAQYRVTVDPPVNEEERDMQQSAPQIYFARFSPDQKYLCYASSWNRRTYVWNVEAGRRHTLPAGANFRVEWAPKTGYLAAATDLNEVTVFAPPDWRPIAVIPDAEIFCWHPSGKQLAYRRRGVEVCVQSIGSEQELRRIQFPSPIRGGGQMAWSADGSRLVVVGAQEGTYVLDESTGEISLTPQLEKQGGAMHGLAVNPTGEMFALKAFKEGYQMGLVALYGESGARLEKQIRFLACSPMRWSPQGNFLAIRERRLNTEQINLYQVRPFKKITSLRSQRRESWADSIWAEDERSLSALRGDGVVWRWDLSALKDRPAR